MSPLFRSERARWITALGRSSGKPPLDRTSLTQVEVVRSFTAKQPDELSLQVADVVLIYQRVGDGEWPSLAQACVARLPGAASWAPASPWRHGCLECSGT